MATRRPGLREQKKQALAGGNSTRQAGFSAINPCRSAALSAVRSVARIRAAAVDQRTRHDPAATAARAGGVVGLGRLPRVGGLLPRGRLPAAAVLAAVLLAAAGTAATLGTGARAPEPAAAAVPAPARTSAAPDGSSRGGRRQPAPPARIPVAADLGPLHPTTATSRPTTSRPTAAPTRPPAGGSGATRSGQATHYTPTGLGNCGFPTVPADGHFVALAPPEYAAAAACGSVLEVHGPAGTVRVTVVDQCPECEQGQLDLGGGAFAEIAGGVPGIVPVTYSRVINPPLAGPLQVRIKEGSSQYWLSVLPLNTGNPLVAVEAATTGGGWRPLTHQSYNYWEAATGVGPGPLTLRVTDDQGHRRILTGLALTPGAVDATTVRMY